MTALTVAQLTQATLDGTGIFDVLMKANKAHLDAEFEKNRIKGAEYSTVYLGSLTQVMQTALQFLLTKDKTALEVDLLTKQVALAQIEIEKATATKLQIEAQTLLIEQQKANLIDELQTATAQRAKLAQETLAVTAAKLQTEAQTLLIGQQKTNLIAEASNIPKQGLLIDAQKDVQVQQKDNLISTKLQVEAQTLLIGQQKANAIIEGTVLVAQECKLRAEYDLTMGNVLKAAQETSLLTQKVATERAQITALGVDADSVVGRQKALYVAQTNGFTRDAEQKAAKVMIDTWNVRRTTDEATVADSTNMLNDVAVGRAVTKLLSGVGA